jgi:hypothetical protein
VSGKSSACVACDCVDDEYFHTPASAGPFCGECWESLNDPDQSLLLEKRVAAYEVEVEQLRNLLTHAANAIECAHRDWGGMFPFPAKLIEEIREETRCED